MLLTGEYKIIFTNAFTWTDWYVKLSKNSFQTMQYPATFVFAKDVVRNPSVFPHNNEWFAIIAREVGSHPSRFVPPFSGHQLLNKCSKRTALSGGVPPAQNRLSIKIPKNPVRLSRQIFFLLTDLVGLYCPLEDTLLNVFAGTSTTATAALHSGCSAILVDVHHLCF